MLFALRGVAQAHTVSGPWVPAYARNVMTEVIMRRHATSATDDRTTIRGGRPTRSISNAFRGPRSFARVFYDPVFPTAPVELKSTENQ